MSVGSVNSVAFTGKTAKTKNGNEYKKSNAAKIGTGVFCLAAQGGAVAYIKKSGSLDSIVELASEMKQISKGKVKGLFAAAMAISLAANIGLGALIDKHINKERAQKADAAAE